MNAKLKAFMVMPFGKSEDEDVYHLYIKPTAEAFGIECKRGDENVSVRNIQSDVVRGIDEADIVIAELTGGNPNVFYELALSHAFNKPTVMICRSINDLPFDLVAHRTIIYQLDPKGLSYMVAQLKALFTAFVLGRLDYSNPVMDSLPDSHFAAVLRTKSVLTIEQNAKKQVCVIAPDIALGPAFYKEVMRNNMIERGIVYRYLIAYTPYVISNCYNFLNELNLCDKKKLFSIKSIGPEYIESDVTLIDPGIPGERGFILAPSEKAEFNFEVIGTSLVRIKERFNTLWLKGNDIEGT